MLVWFFSRVLDEGLIYPAPCDTRTQSFLQFQGQRRQIKALKERDWERLLELSLSPPFRDKYVGALSAWLSCLLSLYWPLCGASVGCHATVLCLAPLSMPAVTSLFSFDH